MTEIRMALLKVMNELLTECPDITASDLARLYSDSDLYPIVKPVITAYYQGSAKVPKTSTLSACNLYTIKHRKLTLTESGRRFLDLALINHSYGQEFFDRVYVDALLMGMGILENGYERTKEQYSVNFEDILNYIRSRKND